MLMDHIHSKARQLGAVDLLNPEYRTRYQAEDPVGILPTVANESESAAQFRINHNRCLRDSFVKMKNDLNKSAGILLDRINELVTLPVYGRMRHLIDHGDMALGANTFRPIITIFGEVLEFLYKTYGRNDTMNAHTYRLRIQLVTDTFGGWKRVMHVIDFNQALLKRCYVRNENGEIQYDTGVPRTHVYSDEDLYFLVMNKLKSAARPQFKSLFAELVGNPQKFTWTTLRDRINAYVHNDTSHSIDPDSKNWTPFPGCEDLLGYEIPLPETHDTSMDPVAVQAIRKVHVPPASNNAKFIPTCFKCGCRGHVVRDCQQRRCSFCGITSFASREAANKHFSDHHPRNPPPHQRYQDNKRPRSRSQSPAQPSKRIQFNLSDEDAEKDASRNNNH